MITYDDVWELAEANKDEDLAVCILDKSFSTEKLHRVASWLGKRDKINIYTRFAEKLETDDDFTKCITSTAPDNNYDAPDYKLVTELLDNNALDSHHIHELAKQARGSSNCAALIRNKLISDKRASDETIDHIGKKYPHTLWIILGKSRFTVETLKRFAKLVATDRYAARQYESSVKCGSVPQKYQKKINELLIIKDILE